MNIKKIIHYTALIFWLFSAGYILYKYSMNTGYWDRPFYISLILFFIIIISRKPFNKLNMWIFFFYIAFGIWVLIDFFLIMTDIFPVE